MASGRNDQSDQFAVNPYLLPLSFDPQGGVPFWMQMWQQTQPNLALDTTQATGLSSLLGGGGLVRPPTNPTTSPTSPTTPTTPTTPTQAPPPNQWPAPAPAPYTDRLLQPGEPDPRIFNMTRTPGGGWTTISGGDTAGPRDANGDYLDPRDDPYSSLNNPGRADNPKGMGKTVTDLMKEL
jgi:hypothetical protein